MKYAAIQSVLFIFALLSLPESNIQGQNISGNYSLSGDLSRVIMITKITETIYLVEEPGGSWPWQGSAVFDGENLYGLAKFKGNRTTMMITGNLRRFDGAIENVKFVFTTDQNGNLLDKIGPGCNGRVDTHIWKKM